MDRLVPLALVTCLLLAACGGTASTTSEEPGNEPGSPATSAEPSGRSTTSEPGSGPDQQAPGGDHGESKPAAVPEVLRFSATTVGGESFDGASLAGTPTLLWFWAPWCPTCRSQVPQVEGLAAEHDGELNVVGVGSLDSAEAIAAFAGDVDGVTHLEDVDGVLYRRFGIAEQSSFVLLDADGEVAFETGYGGSEELGDRVSDVLG